MSSFELNKILGAVLGTCLVLVALNIAAGALFAPEKPAKPGYNIAVEEQPKGGSSPSPAQEQPFETVLASASAERGANAAKICGACHTFTKGGPNNIGPNLYGVVGRPKASEAGFNYSAAMKAKGGQWTLDELNQFLTKPQAYVPGTAMGFPGFPRATQRADVIAYLNSLSDNPKPLPKGAAAVGGAPAAQTGSISAPAGTPPVGASAPPNPPAPAAAPGAAAKPNAPASANAGGVKHGPPAPANPPAAAAGKPTGRSPRPQ